MEHNTKPKVIITGASGFIGMNFLQFMLNHNFEVLNIDLKAPINKNYATYWYQADITDDNVIKKIISDYNPDYLVHFAARTDLDGKSIDDYSANTIGIENICKILSTTKNNIKKVIFTSSMLVCKAGYIPQSSEDYCPSTFYGQSKVIGEKIVKQYSNQLPPWSIIRPTSIWGPWFGVPYIDFFHIVLARKFIFPEKKTCTKTYGYIENASYQIYKILMDTEVSNRETFYIGDDPPIKIADWANEIAMLSGLHKNWQVPYFMLYFLGKIGDLLKLFKINFPMTSFRLKNMTTNNIIPLEKTIQLCGPPLYNRREGTLKTLKWMKTINK